MKLMKPRLSVSAAAFAVAFALNAAAPAAITELPRATPESQGVSARDVTAWVDAVNALKGTDTLHAFVLVRHGQVVAEGAWSPYRSDRVHILNSLSKSFTSTAVGFAVEEGKLALDDRVSSFFPDKNPTNPSPRFLSMRVRDLLTMQSGIEDWKMAGMNAANGGDWVKEFLSLPVTSDPGTHFCYNTGATFLLSAIVQKVTGQDILAYLEPRLFGPLGITDAVWSANAQGIRVGGYGLRLSARDISRFGQFLLNRGTWEGKRLIAAEWIDLATARQARNAAPAASVSASDWSNGYGFQFWRCRPADVYRGDGAFGQYCIVMPRQDAVLAVTADVIDMGAELATVWDKLMPAFKDAPLPPDPEADAALARRLSTLAIKLPPRGASAGSAALKLAHSDCAWSVGTNAVGLKSVALRPVPGGGWMLELENAAGRQSLAVGEERWGAEGKLSLSPVKYDCFHLETGFLPAVAAGAWVAPDDFRVSILFLESPTRLDCDFRPDAKSAEACLGLAVEATGKFGPRSLRFTCHPVR